MEDQTMNIDVTKNNIFQEENKLTFSEGVQAGISIALGYIPIAITFGLLSKASGIPNYISMLMSLTVFAGASQFLGIQLMSLGAGIFEIVTATLILNFRHFLMTSFLSQKINVGVSKKLLSLVAFGVTDETFAVASLREEKKLTVAFILGLNTIAFASWNLGTWIGIFAASAVPQTLRDSMGIALYAMFIGLLVPSIKRSRPVLVVSSAAMLIHWLLRYIPPFYYISTGWTIILSTSLAALIGTVLFPKEVE
jgi:4-azaleucine resistance transporter AzlC